MVDQQSQNKWTHSVGNRFNNMKSSGKNALTNYYSILKLLAMDYPHCKWSEVLILY